MKILVIQGSPRGKEGNTEIIVNQFLKGAASMGAQTEIIHLKGKKIKPCSGCFTCWIKTPGICAINDDMTALIQKVRECDIIVYATPLYNYNMTALLKAFQERLLPLADPHLIKEDGSFRHPQRYPNNRKMVLISNCGFPDTSYFEGLCRVFRHLEKSSNMPLAGEILVPAGETLKQESFREQRKALNVVLERAGVELVRDGYVSRETEKTIQNPLFSPDDIAAMANLWWDSCLTGLAQGKTQTGTVHDIRLVLRGMAALFNPSAAGNIKAVIQFEVTGGQPGNWFLAIEDGKCKFNEGIFTNPSLTINTPSEIWLGITNKEIDGQQAFMEGKYAVKGDMELLGRMKSFFRGAA